MCYQRLLCSSRVVVYCIHPMLYCIEHFTPTRIASESSELASSPHCVGWSVCSSHRLVLLKALWLRILFFSLFGYYDVAHLTCSPNTHQRSIEGHRCPAYSHMVEPEPHPPRALIVNNTEMDGRGMLICYNIKSARQKLTKQICIAEPAWIFPCKYNM